MANYKPPKTFRECKEVMSGGEQEAALSSSSAQPVASQAPPAHPVNEVPDGVTQARQHLMKEANAMMLCLEAAKWTCEQWRERHGHELPNEHFQALCSTYFINLDRNRFVDRLPNRPLK